MEHDELAELYDEFKDYVHNKVRDKDSNPALTVCVFDHMKRTKIHMKLILENVVSVTSSFCRRVEGFRPGTVYKTEENLKDGGSTHMVYIPIESEAAEKKHRSKGGGSRSGDGGPPNQMYLVGYVFMLLLTIIVAVAKTSMADWRYMLGQ